MALQTGTLKGGVYVITNAYHQNNVALSDDGSIVSNTIPGYEEASSRKMLWTVALLLNGSYSIRNTLSNDTYAVGPAVPKLGDAIVAKQEEQHWEIKETGFKTRYVIYRDAYQSLFWGLRSKEIGTQVTLQPHPTNTSNQWEFRAWTGELGDPPTPTVQQPSFGRVVNPKYHSSKRQRKSIWNVVHADPYTILEEDFLPSDASGEPKETFETWISGTYIFTYPQSSHLATISIALDWNAFDDPYKPSCQWRIDTPESLYYPGTHRGDLIFAKFGGNALDARIKVQWSSPILSPFVTERGQLSSDGYLEESMIVLAFTLALKSLARMLAFGPYNEKGSFPDPPFWFHQVSGEGFRYLTRGKDRFTRAASFFSRAYTLKVPEDDHFTAIGFSDQCRQTSITVIQELLEFHNVSLLQEHTALDSEWNFRQAFAGVNSQREWAMEERRWADKITAACGIHL